MGAKNQGCQCFILGQTTCAIIVCIYVPHWLASTTFTKSNKENHFISKRLKVPPHTFFVLACYIEESGQKRNQTWFLFNLTPSKEL